MSSFRKAVIVGAIAAGSIALAPVSHAAVIVQNFTIPTQDVPFSNTFTFNLFDTTLGSLNSVVLSLTTSATTVVQILNNTNAAISYTNATAVVPVTLTGPGPVVVSTNPTAGPFAGSAAANMITTISGGTVSATNSILVATANFGLYSGVGTNFGSLIAASAGGSYTGSSSSTGGLFFGGDATAGGSFRVTYDFDPRVAIVPVPGAAVFLGSGLLLVVGLSRRARKNASA